MRTTPIQNVGLSVASLAALTLLAACANEAPLAPQRPAAVPAQLEALASQQPELGTCQNLKPPTSSKLAFHAYATGVQIYRWSGTSWSLYGPAAVLSSDAEGRSKVGTHYVGPTWESVSGSKVVASVIDRCTADPNAVQWLSLGAVSSGGPGAFHRVTFIQRVNTVGGKAPATGGTFVGQEVSVPYAAEYFFYRAQ